MKFIISILLGVLCTFRLTAQQVIISGACPGPECEGAAITISRPIAGFTNNFLKDENVVQVSNGQFAVSFDLTSAGFVLLESKCFNKLKLFASPGDSIHFECRRNDTGKPVFRFTGSNAAGHELFNNGLLFSNGIENTQYMRGLLKKEKTPDAIIRQLKTKLSGYTALLDALYQQQKISETFRQNMQAEIESNAFFFAGNMLLSIFRSRESPNPIQHHLNEQSQKAALALLAQTYDPYLPKYQYTTTIFTNAGDRARLIMWGILPDSGAVHNTAFWEKMGPAYKMYTYAPPHLQQMLMGNNLLANIAFRSQNVNELTDEINTFKGAFPQSGYTAILPELLSAYAAANSAPIPHIRPYGLFSDDSNSWIYSGDSIPDYKDVKELVAANFQGVPVFVDFWATWCSPCKAEFAYEKPLHAFLKKHNIQTLYVSMDYESYMPEWKKFIERYKLGGYHYFSSKPFRQSLEKTFQTSVISIPRYLLFDKNGNLVEVNALRPSSGDKLLNQIKERLNIAD